MVNKDEYIINQNGRILNYLYIILPGSDEQYPV